MLKTDVGKTGIFLGVPPNLRIPKQPCKNGTIFSIFWYFLNSGVPPSFFETNSVPRADKG